MTMPSALRGIVERVPSPEDWADRTGDRIAAALGRRARAGTPGAGRLRAAVRLPWHALLAWLLFSFFLLDTIVVQAGRGLPAAWLAAAAIPAGLLVLRRPVLLGLVMAAAAVWLRAIALGVPETCDQMAVSRAALGVISGGGNPWGFGYAESVPPGAPFPYGPLAAFTSILGVPGEVAAMAGILLILAWSRALITLALLGAWIAWIDLGVCGINDQVPALLLLAGLLLLERRRLPGALLVALSVGIKPYAAAWIPPLMGFGGVTVSVALLAATALAWLPALWWGPRSYLDSIELARGVHARPENTLNMPALRILALPVAIAGLFVRRWSTAVLTGALIFLIVLFLDFWASFGYWLVVLPPVGIVLERALRELGVRVRVACAPAERQGQVAA